MTRPEIARLTGLMIFLRRVRVRLRHGGVKCYWAVIGDEVLDLPEGEARQVFQAATSSIVQAQDRADIPQYWICVLESTSGLHANIIFLATPKIAERFARSAFSKYLGADLRGLQPVGLTVKDWKAVTDYLAGERTPQAEYAIGHRLGGPRLKGSHRLGAGGGDRVWASRALRKDALAAGDIEPWQRTTSRNLKSVGRRPAPVEAVAVRPALPSSERDSDGTAPVRIRAVPFLRTVSVGSASEPPRPQPEQLPLFQELPCHSPPFSTGAEVRELRELTGMTQERLAGRIGIRDRSHVANVERGHDRLSPQRRRLLRHFAETERLAA